MTAQLLYAVKETLCGLPFESLNNTLLLFARLLKEKRGRSVYKT